MVKCSKRLLFFKSNVVILFAFILFVGCSKYDLTTRNKDKETYEYAQVNGQHLLLDVYQPKETEKTKHPVMIWMHGGGFSVGGRDLNDEPKFMQHLADEGYVAISISYRLLRKGQESGFGCDCSAEDKRMVFREAAKDLWKAIAYVYDHAEEWNIDTSKIIVGGSSAGAEAVNHAVYLRDWVFEDQSVNEFLEIKDIPLAGVLSLAGAIVDQRYITEQSAVPGIFYHGTSDSLVPYATAPHHYCNPARLGYIWLDGSKTITNRLDELNSPFILVTYPNADHEISGIPFGEMDKLMEWMDELFLKKKFMQLEIEKK